MRGNSSDRAHRARNQNRSLLLSAGIVALCGVALPAAAQDDAEGSDEIVVTGTQIRGVAPVGASPITLDEEAVEASGAYSSNELLATIPQLQLFNTLPQGVADFGSTTIRPNIRSLGASGSSTTLVLLNGQRMAGVGILATTPDAGIVPPNALQRVEVVTGGGSAVYGADAVGGVINFITRDRFEGTEIGARYGFADEYETYDIDLTHGLNWDTGSAIVSYTHSNHSELMGEDRDYRIFDFTPVGGGDRRSRSCGNASAGGQTAIIAGGALRCALDGQLYPKESRDTVFATLRQDLADNVEFRTTAYWSHRETETIGAPLSSGGPSASGVTINNANPNFDPNLFAAADTSHVVRYNYSSVFGNPRSPAEVESFGFTPELIVDLNNDWELRGSLNAAFSSTENHDRTSINIAAERAAGIANTEATALNPYNLSDTPADVLASIRDYERFAEADQTQLNARVVVDGALFAVPAGEVRLAFGGELASQSIDAHTSDGRIGLDQNALRAEGGRELTSVFGELYVPVIGADNALPLVRSFDLSLAVRYDDYSDFGDTTNPKVGFNWRPIDDLLIRGNWGTSFVAPSLADSNGGVDTRLQITSGLFSSLVVSLTPQPSPFVAGDENRPIVVVAGGNPDLNPEESEAWEIGFDWDAPFIEGLQLSATYYNIDYSNQISVPLLQVLSDPNYASGRVLLPSLAELQAFVNGIDPGLPIEGGGTLEELYGPGALEPVAGVDFRRRNVGAVNIFGIDTAISYNHEMDWGRVFASLTGTQVLERDEFSTPGAAAVDGARRANSNANDYFFTASAGVQIDQVLLRLSTAYTPGYSRTNATENPLLQDEVDSFQTWDVFAKYDFNPEGPLGDASVTLNVDNIFEEEPSYLVNTAGGTGIGATLGRLITVGVRKRF